MKRLLFLPLALLTGCEREPCHTRHQEVKFEAAHRSYEYDFLEEDWVWKSYPDQCHVRTICDVECRAVDQGKLESHGKHEVLNTPVVNHDSRHCTDAGRVR